ncbi:MAG: diphosphomevalonate decarboxylase [Scardovia wiggsiae]
MTDFAAARAHANIALIKYWGKRDASLILPTSESLSLTLDPLYTDTAVSFIDGAEDQFILDGAEQGGTPLERVRAFIGLFRQYMSKHKAENTSSIGISGEDCTSLYTRTVRVESHNHVPTAAGMASSASAFAALAWALRDLYGLHGISDRQLSTFARRGSGSALRSIFGGFVKWKYGTGDNDSYAIQVDDAQWDVGAVIIALSTKQKKTGSRSGMAHTVNTSAFYPLWREASEADLKLVEEGIRKRDINEIGKAMEANVMKFHAVMFAADPPLTYMTAESWKVIEHIWSLREQGIPCYFTMDAGPNVTVLCPRSYMDRIAADMRSAFPQAAVIPAASGPAPEGIPAHEWRRLYGK